MIRLLLSGIALLALCLANLVLLYMVLASPPIHLVYDAVPPAGPSSVYVPGSGFSGFWFHLGALQAIPKLHDYDFYCYSSGCLSVVLAGMNVSVSDAFGVCYDIQQSWLSGNMSRFDIVDVFLDGLLGDDAYSDRLDAFLPNLNILVTSKGKGVEVVQPQTHQQLVQALKQTTWIPFVTGEGVLRPTNKTSSSDDATCPATEDEFYLDGGFSRVLHPPCEFDLWVPNTWINMLYTLNPALTPDMVDILWQDGSNFDHPLLTSQ